MHYWNFRIIACISHVLFGLFVCFVDFFVGIVFPLRGMVGGWGACFGTAPALGWNSISLAPWLRPVVTVSLVLFRSVYAACVLLRISALLCFFKAPKTLDQ